MGRPLGASARIVDLFAGPGGLDVGASWLGLSACGIEIDSNACETRAAAGLQTVMGDVRAYGPEDFPDATILAGGPPCQTFTIAGRGTGRKFINTILGLIEELAADVDITDRLRDLEDERTGLVVQPLRWALEAKRAGVPYEAVVLEQVPAVLPIWEAVAGVLRSANYDVDCDVLAAEAFGVPQTRRRAVLIARLNGSAQLPKASHQTYRKGVVRQNNPDVSEWVSIEDALRLGSDYSVISNYGSGGDPRKRGRRASDEPAATVTGKVTRNRLQHSAGHQSRLTLHQAGLLQTFPADYPWSGGDVGQQIGNAIPPRLAAHILAAATGQRLDTKRLDETVRMNWNGSRGGIDQLAHPIASHEELIAR
ncbi:DNA cytosine methyltransferase [Williamsia sp. M5A3_1d]